MDLSNNKRFRALKARMIKHFIELPGDFDLDAFGYKEWETDEPPAKIRKQIESMSDDKAFEIILIITESELSEFIAC